VQWLTRQLHKGRYEASGAIDHQLNVAILLFWQFFGGICGPQLQSCKHPQLQLLFFQSVKDSHRLNAAVSLVLFLFI